MSTVLMLVGSKLLLWQQEIKYGIRGGKEASCGTGENQKYQYEFMTLHIYVHTHNTKYKCCVTGDF